MLWVQTPVGGFWLTVAIFGLVHGVTVQSGELAVNLWAIVGTGFMGFVLTWMRERTGSLVVPILFHNISNVFQAFV
jgi:membrane protease YdiL (CAAX protease family)